MRGFPIDTLRFSSFAAILATILYAEHRCNEAHRFKSILAAEKPYLLESSHRPLCSANELVGEAGRFRETITDGAGKDDLLRSAQIDQVTDTDEDRLDAVLRAQHAADHLAVVDQGRDRAEPTAPATPTVAGWRSPASE
jgi:hypothetical protein